MSTRRDVTRRGVLAMAPAALAAGMDLGARTERHPLAAKAGHHPARAKRVIVFFLTGGASHMDSFDPKPALNRLHGKKSRPGRKFIRSPWEARKRGNSGLLTTDLFPSINGAIDDLCLIRSMHGNHSDHFEATLHMHTGSNGETRPGIGAWVSFGMGTDNPNLPPHIVFAKEKPYAGSQSWDSNFLPAYHQGVRILPGDEPIPHVNPDRDLAPVQDLELAMLRRINRVHAGERGKPNELMARILSFDTATSIQNLAPELFDLRGESKAIRDLYGVRDGDNRSFGWQCLMARRMAERGVRFIELVDRNWDHHSGLERGHSRQAKVVDRGIGALVRDLKQRGMLEETLVVFCTEFGRTADTKNNGRDHHAKAFTCWLAGGGVKPGFAYGATNETGMEIAENPVHVHDFHATILHLLGIDHERLTFRHAGRDFRLTDVHGNVVRAILT